MEHYGFFNNGDEYGQEELNRYFDKIYESGIGMDGNGQMDYPITIGSGQVSVGVGFAILRGAYHYNDSARVFPLAPDANLPKIYRVIVRSNMAEMKTMLLVRSGSAASNPQPPALVRDNVNFEVSLGQYRVERSGEIKLVRDERSDVTVCGLSRPKNLNAYTAAMEEYQRRFEEWFAAQQGKGWRNIFAQEDTPADAVEGSIWMEQTNVSI